MKEVIKARTKAGKTYDAVIDFDKINVFDTNPWIFGKIYIAGNSYDIKFESLIDGTCVSFHRYGLDREKLSKDLGIKNLPDGRLKIFCDDYRDITDRYIKKKLEEHTKLANEVEFTKISFTYHSYYKWTQFFWDAKLENNLRIEYLKLNKTVDKLEEILPLIDRSALSEFETGVERDDYNICTHYEMSRKQVQHFIETYSEVADKAKKEREEEEERIQQKKENIKNGDIYFHCESRPHDVDLSNVVLNCPAPNGGSFTLEHRISKDLFNRIKSYGVYYSEDDLEEYDMFYHSPGWRFSSDAIKELQKTNKVYIDNVEVE